MNARINRRRFLAQSVAGGAGLLVLRGGASARTYEANDKLNVALVGVGGRGEWFVETIPKLENVVALCDVNDQKMAIACQRMTEKKPKSFRDFRKMLDEMGRQIDAVVVATPDHTHAVVSAAAMHAGKHVFCEKPLTRTVGESRALRESARKCKVATAMGNQGTYSGPFRRALELIRGGTLGEIKEVHVWNDAGGPDKREPPKGEPPVPDYLQWDLWLGPAASRPYHPDWLQRNSWRDFGTCQLGNWASHTANLGFRALLVAELWLRDEPTDPRPLVRIQAEHSGVNRLSFPRWEVIKWEIPARTGLPPITITWYNGPTPRVADVLAVAMKGVSAKDENLWRFAGTLIVGTKGSIHTTGHNMWFRLLPEEQFQGVQCNRPETVADSRGPEQDWFAACRGGIPAWSNFHFASALNEFLMLGNVATQFENKLEFDPFAMKIVNDPAADALLHYDYRQGWSL